MRHNFRFSAVVLAIATVAAASLPFSSPAAAATLTYDRNVNAADLNLASPQGEAALNRRIAIAALKVCTMSDEPDVAAADDNLDCRINAVREASRSAKRLVAEARQAAAYASAGGRIGGHS